MAQTVTFDMYVRTGDRWQQYAQFIELERDDALDTAKQLDLEPETKGVRIIRVTSFGSNRAPLETLEWISPSLKRNAAPGDVKKRNQAPGANTHPPKENKKSSETSEAARAQNQKKTASKTNSNPKPSITPVIAKGAGIVILSALLSVGLFTPATFAIKRFEQSGFSAPPLYQEIAAFMICALVFVVLAAVSFRLFVSTDDLKKLSRKPPPARSARPARKPARAPVTMPGALPENTPTEPSFVPQLSEHDTATAPMLDEDTSSSEPQQRPAPLPTRLDEEYRISMLRFLEGSLSELSDILTTLDQYSRFGINLFLGGAGDRFSSKNGLGGIQRFILIRETISALGTQADMVDVFCEKFDAYDQDAKYHFMTEAGRRTLDKYLAGDANCFRELPDLIKRWRRSNSATAQAQGIITIMFTDLVGSTQMTHDHGDLGAQEVVRAHNAIVRNALAQYHGEEVKHTGDGIMASFASAPNSVRATIEIQREIEKHNAANPNLPVRVRIGLNAGDAVREEDDFFGQTVQLAARICDKADEREIYITPSVHMLCIDHAFDLTEAGQYELKGIDEPVQAYAVNWQLERAVPD